MKLAQPVRLPRRHKTRASIRGNEKGTAGRGFPKNARFSDKCHNILRQNATLADSLFASLNVINRRKRTCAELTTQNATRSDFVLEQNGRLGEAANGLLMHLVTNKPELGSCRAGASVASAVENHIEGDPEDPLMYFF